MESPQYSSRTSKADMDYLKSIVLVLLAGVLALAVAQDYLNYDDDLSPRGRVPIANVVRVRRQGVQESPRFRRQGGGGEGVTGPVHTFVKTDEHAHFKWGVRHHVGHEYAGRR